MIERNIPYIKRMPFRAILILAVLFCGAMILGAYFHDLRIVNCWVNYGSKIIATPVGTVEYYTYGSGKPVLISHGAGGGFDQGLLISREFFGKGYRFILPSRFGYLRSKTNHKVTARLQAEAYAYILKDLGISKVSVASFSAGGPAALSFAANYPGQCENLIMMSSISAPIVNSKDDPVKTLAFRLLYQSNFLYWTVTKVFRSQLLSLYGLTAKDQQKLSGPDNRLIDDLFATTMPVSLRAQGNFYDIHRVLPSVGEVESIKAPTLIIHVRQDPLIIFRNAEYTHRHVSGSILVPLEYGGHFLMGHQREVAARVRAFMSHTL